MSKNAKPKKKLCWNCEGRASFQDENCPYCGVYLSPLSISGKEDKEDNLFAPPYRLDTSSEDNDVPPSPFAAPEEAKEEAKADILPAEGLQKPIINQLNSAIISLMLLLAGSVFLFFSLALLLFSRNGVLTLHWNGDIWFVYLILSLPMLFFGWRYLQQSKD